MFGIFFIDGSFIFYICISFVFYDFWLLFLSNSYLVKVKNNSFYLKIMGRLVKKIDIGLKFIVFLLMFL